MGQKESISFIIIIDSVSFIFDNKNNNFDMENFLCIQFLLFDINGFGFFTHYVIEQNKRKKKGHLVINGSLKINFEQIDYEKLS